MVRQAKEDELVDSRIRSMDSSVSMDDKSDIKKTRFWRAKNLDKPR